MKGWKKGTVRVQMSGGQREIELPCLIDPSMNWAVYKFNLEIKRRASWSVGHVKTCRLVVDGLTKKSAMSLAERLGQTVKADFNGEGKPGMDFQCQVVKALGSFDLDLVPLRLRHLLKEKGGKG